MNRTIRLFGSVVLAVGFFILSLKVHADDSLDELKGRVEALEKNEIELQKKQSLIQSFDAKSFSIGGFTSTELGSQFGGQTSSETSFSESKFDLIFSGTVRDNLKVFTNLHFGYVSDLNNQNSAARAVGARKVETEIEVATIEYNFSRYFALQVGRIVTPFGIINTDYFAPLLLQFERPQGFRETSVDNTFIFFEDNILGAQGFGSWSFAPGHILAYAVYLGSPRTHPNSVEPGSRLYWSLPDDLFQFGVSNQFTYQPNNGRSSVYGVDFKMNFKPFVLQAEYLKSNVESGADQTSYYVQPSYHFANEHWILFAQLDYLKNPLSLEMTDVGQTSIPTPIEKYEYTLGVNYLPFPVLRTRVEYTTHHYIGENASPLGVSRDYNSVIASATLSF